MSREQVEENKTGQGSRNNGNNALLLAAESVRTKTVVADEAPAKPAASEGNMSMFWRVFGGTILSIVALVVITAYNGISGSLSDLRRDLNAQIETKSDLVKKSDLERTSTSLWTAVKEVRATAHSAEGLNERAKTLEQQVDRHAKTAGDDRKELASRIEENRKNAAEESRDLAKKVEELRRAIEEERKEFLRKLDEQRKLMEDERKDMLRKFEDQHKEMTGKLQVMAERLAAVESKQSFKAKATAPSVEPPSKAKAKSIESGQ